MFPDGTLLIASLTPKYFHVLGTWGRREEKSGTSVLQQCSGARSWSSAEGRAEGRGSPQSGNLPSLPSKCVKSVLGKDSKWTTSVSLEK